MKLTSISHELAWEFLAEVLKYGVVINSVLFFLNILPIPPLDGYGVLESLAPSRWSSALAAFRPMGSFIFIALILFGALQFLLLPAIYVVFFLIFVAQLFTGLA